MELYQIIYIKATEKEWGGEKTKYKSELTKSLFFILTGKNRKVDLYKHAAIL